MDDGGNPSLLPNFHHLSSTVSVLLKMSVDTSILSISCISTRFICRVMSLRAAVHPEFGTKMRVALQLLKFSSSSPDLDRGVVTTDFSAVIFFPQQ